MYGIALFFLGFLFFGFIGPDAVDLVKMPFGLDLPEGATHGAGTVVLADGIKMLEVPFMAQLPCRMYSFRYCTVYCHGAGVGVFVTRQ